MTIRLLRTLVAIADHKTFSAAAETVHVTHAAVSQQMQSLEADLGLKLFDRTKRTPELTPIAHEIVAKARILISDYENLVPSVLDESGLMGPIKVGAVGTTLTGLMPRAMASLKIRFPDTGLHIRPGLTANLLTDIERSNLDAAVISRPHLMPAGVTFQPLVEERLELIASVEETQNDPLLLLRTKPFIRFNRNAVLGSVIDSWLLSKSIHVKESMELDSAEAIASMVHANLGVSIVPRLTVRPHDLHPYKGFELGGDAPTRWLGLAYRKDQVKTRSIRELLGALSTVIDQARTDPVPGIPSN
ncbi:MAG: LysR family transcriptional regulator [Pseudomonadota bacterium]